MTEPDLLRTRHRPEAVALARQVFRPDAVTAPGGAILRPRSGPARLVLDFGRELVGRLHFETDLPAAVTLHVSWGEDLTEALLTTPPQPATNWYRHPVDAMELAPGRAQCVTPGRRAFRFVHLWVEEGAVELAIARLEAEFERYPTEDLGHFSCDDADLNRAWEISRHGLRCCMQRYYEDGVKRDGLLWVGDYRVEYLINAHVFGDTALARRSLRLIAATQTPEGDVRAAAIAAGGHQHPHAINYMSVHRPFLLSWVLHNYTADFVAGLAEYARYSGDLDFARELLPSVMKAARRLAGLDLATQRPHLDFLTDDQPDSTSGWWGSRAALLLHVAAAWRDLAELLAWLGHADGAAEWRARAERILADFAARPREAGTGLFLDEGETRPSWHTNALALACGVALDRSAAELVHELVRRPEARRPRSGYALWYVLEGLFAAGAGEAALALLRGFFRPMLRNGATTPWDLSSADWEDIERPTTHALSHCHGWSGSPALHLPRHVLGLRPTRPGWAELTVAPALYGLEWASATVPTPRGFLEAHAAGRGDGVEVFVRVPEGAIAVLGAERIGPGEHRRVVAAATLP